MKLRKVICFIENLMPSFSAKRFLAKEQYLYLKELARVKTPLFLRSEDIPTSEELSISYQYGILNWLRLDATLDTLREISFWQN